MKYLFFLISIFFSISSYCKSYIIKYESENIRIWGKVSCFKNGKIIIDVHKLNKMDQDTLLTYGYGLRSNQKHLKVYKDFNRYLLYNEMFDNYAVDSFLSSTDKFILDRENSSSLFTYIAPKETYSYRLILTSKKEIKNFCFIERYQVVKGITLYQNHEINDIKSTIAIKYKLVPLFCYSTCSRITKTLAQELVTPPKAMPH